jgi:hypothetical protein
MARGNTIDELARRRQLTDPEIAGHDAVGRERAAPPIPDEAARQNALWQDAESLVAIARRHAAIAMASPPEARTPHLDACRMVWINYAAAFSTSPATRELFADQLQDATRALMTEPPQSDGAMPALEAQPRSLWRPQAAVSAITLEELRLILQQIIRQ